MRNLKDESKLFAKWASKLGDNYMDKAIDRLMNENKELVYNQNDLATKLDKYFDLEFRLREELSPEKGKKNLSIIKNFKNAQNEIFKKIKNGK